MPSKTLTLSEGSNTDRDTFILSNLPTTNFDANGTLSVGKSADGSDAHRRTLLYRNILADFPTGVIFDTAVEELYWDGMFNGSGSPVAWVYKITDPSNWVENQVTENQRKNDLQGGLLWGTPGGDFADPPARVSFDIPSTGSAGYVPSNDMAHLFQDAYDNENGDLGLIHKKDVETTGLKRFANFSDSGQAGQEPRFLVAYHIMVGYNLYLKAGSSPNPDVDQAIASVDSSATSVALDVTSLGLKPNTGYFGLVSPFNTIGRATSSALFRFLTDGAGLPLIVPSPVSRLTATPLAGGNVRVNWTYDEQNPIAVADTFEIEVFNDTSSFPFSVPHVVPKRTYARDLIVGAEGLFQVRVRSDKGGLSHVNVSPVPVMLDSTPPDMVPVTLSAV